MKKFYKLTFLFLLALIPTNLALVAEVVYVDIVPDKVISPPVGGGQSFSIDLNNDNHIDFSIQINNFAPYKSVRVSGILRGNQIAGDGDTLAEGNFLPLSLSKYDKISPNMECLWFNDWDEAWGHDLPFPIGGYGLNSEGHWTGALKEKYLAVRFIIEEGYYHYGWIEIEVSEQFDACTIKGYAYDNEVNEPINAGETGTGINDLRGRDGISMYPNPAQNLLNIQSIETCIEEIEIFNILGNSVKCVRSSNYNNFLSASIEDLSDGLYYCTIRGDQKSIVRRFVIAR